MSGLVRREEARTGCGHRSVFIGPKYSLFILYFFIILYLKPDVGGGGWSVSVLRPMCWGKGENAPQQNGNKDLVSELHDVSGCFKQSWDLSCPPSLSCSPGSAPWRGSWEVEFLPDLESWNY